MKTLFALITGALMGTIAALWLAARGERGQASTSAAIVAPAGRAVTPSEPTGSEEAPQ